MEKLELLDREEALVLESLKKRNKPVKEDDLHMLFNILDIAGRGLGFEYELKYFEQIDARFISSYGSVPYSQKLHEIIENLARKNYISRDSENPIQIKTLTK